MEHKVQLSGQDIDNILDEIDEKEKQITNRKIIDHDANWPEIIKQLRIKNIKWIKKLIRSNKISINSIEPTTGNTLLIYSVIIGDFDLVKTISDFGANVFIKNKYNLDALDYAMKYSKYPITELIYYHHLSGGLGSNLKDINREIHKKNKQANYIFQYKKPKPDSKKHWEDIIDFTITAMNEKAEFNENMLYYSWYFILLNSSKDQTNPFDSELWKTMINVFENILSNLNDKIGWNWLKKYFLNSPIWYLPHPNNVPQIQEQKDDIIDMESILKTSLFYELLTRVRTETKKQTDLTLAVEINKIKTSGDWNELIVFKKEAINNRQDTSGCLLSKYHSNDFKEEMFPPAFMFEGKRYYDVNIYCSELVFRAEILDGSFQSQMKKITGQINEAVHANAVYRSGPVKTLAKAQVKVENELVNHDYPTSAGCLNLNRCAIQFDTIRQMLDYVRLLSNRVEHGQAGCIKKILGCQNGWSGYNFNYPKYTDLKLNVLVETGMDGNIIAEVQFLLNFMSEYKKKSDKLYLIEGKYNLVYNYQTLARKMGQFANVNDINIVFHNLALTDDVRYFEDLWENYIEHSIYNLAAYKICVHILMNPGGKIDKYLTDNYKQLYRESILFHINCTMKIWFLVLEDVTQCNYNPLQFIKKFIHLFDTNIAINDIKHGTEMLRSFNIIFDLLNHSIYSYIDAQNNKIKAPFCKDFNGCHYHNQTQFKLVNDSYEGGKVYAFGDGNNGQLGIKEYEAKTCKKPNIVLEFDNNHQHLLAMDSYDSHHLAIDVNHKAYSWGNDDYGQLGGGKKLFAKAIKPIPNLLPAFKKYNVINVAVGKLHSLILTNDGNVWAFGDNRKGQLGNGKTSKDGDKNPTPKIIKKLAETKEYFINVSAGSEHSAAVSKTGKLFCWGNNEHGECGVNFDLGKLMVLPYEVEINKEYENSNSFNPFYALEAGCGWNYTLLLTTNHSILWFGQSLVDTEKNYKPTIIPNLSNKRIMHMSCSNNHSLFVTEDGELYTYGSGICGMLGHGTDTVEILPKRVEYFVKNNIKIIDCEGGNRHSGVISETGELYTFGRNGSKELGYKYVMESKTEYENDSDPYNSIPKKVDFFNNVKVRYMSFGKMHSHIVVSDDDEKKDDEDAHFLEPNSEERIWCPAFKMYIKNEKLFGKFWILLAQKKY